MAVRHPVGVDVLADLVGEMASIYRPNDSEATIERLVRGYNAIAPYFTEAEARAAVALAYARPADGDYRPGMPTPNDFLDLVAQARDERARREIADRQRQSEGRRLAAPPPAEITPEAAALAAESEAAHRAMMADLRAKLRARLASAPPRSSGHLAHALGDLMASANEGSPALAAGLRLAGLAGAKATPRDKGVKARRIDRAPDPAPDAPAVAPDVAADAGLED